MKVCASAAPSWVGVRLIPWVSKSPDRRLSDASRTAGGTVSTLNAMTGLMNAARRDRNDCCELAEVLWFGEPWVDPAWFDAEVPAAPWVVGVVVPVAAVPIGAAAASEALSTVDEASAESLVVFGSPEPSKLLVVAASPVESVSATVVVS